jgi:hypothetical protein
MESISLNELKPILFDWMGLSLFEHPDEIVDPFLELDRFNRRLFTVEPDLEMESV